METEKEVHRKIDIPAPTLHPTPPPTPPPLHPVTGCLPVEQAHVIYQDLVRAQQCLVLSTDLHLLHISTPPDLTSTITPNWMVYFETVSKILSK